MSDVSGLLSISSRVDGRTAVIELAGELDVGSVPALSSVVGGLLDQPLASIEIDAAELSFVDSGGLRALLLARRAADAVDVRLGLVHTSPAVQRVLEMTCLDEHLGSPEAGGPGSSRW